jgi:O-antigen/teichoic acid export membrane protein
MLGFFQSSADVGVYRVAVQGATLVAFGLQVANFLIAPQFARLYALGDKAVLQRLVTMSARIILFASLPVALALMFAGGTIAGWLFGPEFEKSHMPMAILAGGQLISSVMGSVALLLSMSGHERDVARIMVFSAGLNILLNIVLIPPFQLVGAASATTISLATWNILLYRVVKERMGIDSTALAVG